MRNEFIKTLIELARQDERIVLLTADLGFKVIEPFVEAFPDRFINVGVAEQNMVGISTGLAEAGYIPFLYSIANFATLRPYEFLRNGPILHNLPVRIIGIGGGFDYGSAGITHYGLEDIGVLRIQENLTLVIPSDAEQARNALLRTWDMPRPVYYRISKEVRHLTANLNGEFQIGFAQTLRQGSDAVVISIGPMAQEAGAAIDMLSARGISCTHVLVSNFNPSPTSHLTEILKNFRLAFTVEDHYVTGGLGSYVSEVVAESGLPCQVVRCGIKSLQPGLSGSRNSMLEKYGLSSQGIADNIHNIADIILSRVDR